MTESPEPGQRGPEPTDPLLKITLMISVLLMVGGLCAFLLQINIGGVLFAAGLGLLSLFAGVRGLLSPGKASPWVSLVFLCFGVFMLWLIVNPYLSF